jgi:hypothetical protein
MVCGFYPSFIPAAEKSFEEVDVFKLHYPRRILVSAPFVQVNFEAHKSCPIILTAMFENGNRTGNEERRMISTTKTVRTRVVWLVKNLETADWRL